MPERGAVVGAPAAVERQVLEVPAEFVEAGQQRVLLHGAVALQNVEPEALEKEVLAA